MIKQHVVLASMFTVMIKYHVVLPSMFGVMIKFVVPCGVFEDYVQAELYFSSLRCLLLLYCVLLDLRIGERFVAEVLDCSAGTIAYSR